MANPLKGEPPCRKRPPYTCGALFAIGTIAHAVRLFTNFEIVIAGFDVPVWVSFPGTLIVALLTAWTVIAARRT